MIDSKKGSTSEYWFRILYIAAVGVAAAFLVIFFKSMAHAEIKSSERLEPYIIAQSLMPKCFAYSEESGRVYGGVIDFDKFTKDTLDRCYRPSAQMPAFAMALSFDNGEVQLKTSNWREGRGIISKVQKRVYVALHKDLMEGMLIISSQYEG